MLPPELASAVKLFLAHTLTLPPELTSASTSLASRSDPTNDPPELTSTFNR